MRNPKHKLEGTVDNVHLRIGRRHNVGNAAGVLLNLQVGDIANRQKTTQDRMLVSHLKQRRYLGGIREASGLLRQIKKQPQVKPQPWLQRRATHHGVS